MLDSQAGLFQNVNILQGAVELFPAAWTAAEALVSADEKLRRAALVRLQELGAPRLSPLIAYLVATRLSDPDMELRTQAARIIGSLLVVDAHGNASPAPVRSQLAHTLGQMRTRNVYHLLEIALADPETSPHLTRILNACPYAGRHLADIAMDRMLPLNLRKQSVWFIGAVGYLDAIPSLERLAARLESRLSGQQSMPFAPPGQAEEMELLPIVRSVLELLRAP